jgi:hypothetical protein
MVKKNQNLRPAIYFTAAGKNKLATLMAGLKQQGTFSSFLAQGKGAITSFQAAPAPIIYGAGQAGRDEMRQGMAGLEKILPSFVYAGSAAMQAKRSMSNRQPGLTPGALNVQPGKQVAGEQSFNRVEQNYLQDKQLLASPIQHTAGGGTPGTSAGAADKNVIRETADEFIDTIKRILKDSL